MIKFISTLLYTSFLLVQGIVSLVVGILVTVGGILVGMLAFIPAIVLVLLGLFCLSILF